MSQIVFLFEDKEYTPKNIHLLFKSLSLQEEDNTIEEIQEDIIVDTAPYKEPIPIKISRIFGCLNIIEIETDVYAWNAVVVHNICLEYGKCSLKTGSNGKSFIVVYDVLSSLIKCIYDQTHIICLIRDLAA